MEKFCVGHSWESKGLRLEKLEYLLLVNTATVKVDSLEGALWFAIQNSCACCPEVNDKWFAPEIIVIVAGINESSLFAILSHHFCIN